jgi:hypothetical protein
MYEPPFIDDERSIGRPVRAVALSLSDMRGGAVTIHGGLIAAMPEQRRRTSPE